MKKSIILFLLLFVFINVFALSELRSPNYLIYNLTEDKIMYEKNTDKEIQIASLTKLITILTAIEKTSNLDAKVIIDNSLFKGLKEEEAAVAGFVNNEQVTINDLLYAAKLPSGADATRALADHLFFSDKKFVNEMNKLTKKIKMNNTKMTNSTGLDYKDEHSTINDLLKFMKYALKNDDFKEIFYTHRYTTSNERLKFESTHITSAERTGLDVNFIKGVKTGYTLKAGQSLIATFDVHGNEILIITTGIPNDNFYYPNHLVDAINIYEYLNENYKSYTPVTKGEIFKNIKPIYSTDKYNLIYTGKEINYLLNKNDDVKVEYTYLNNITNLNKNNAGEFKILVNNKEVHKDNLLIEDKIKFSLIEFIKVHKIVLSITLLFNLSLLIIYKKVN